MLRSQLNTAGAYVDLKAVHTDARSKEDGSGAIKLLLQQGDLKLPRHPALLGQLAALEYEATDTGLVRIAVPERAGTTTWR